MADSPDPEVVVEQLRQRLRLVEGYLAAYERPAELIELIAEAADDRDAVERVGRAFEVDRFVSEQLRDMTLRRFTGEQRELTRREREDLRQRLDELT